MTRLALLPSALLGPAVWEPVRSLLAAAGHEVVVAGDPAAARGSVAEIERWYLAGLPDDGDYVLVPHSNAGLYVPALTRRRSVTGLVFVDAILPPRTGDIAVAPEGLRAMLRELAGPERELPPWTNWWSEEDVAPLFPPGEARARVEAEQRRLPLAYFEESVTVAPGWDEVPAAYLGFGDTYGPERAEAAGRGWRTATLDGLHLHMLREPVAVAAAVESLTP